MHTYEANLTEYIDHLYGEHDNFFFISFEIFDRHFTILELGSLWCLGFLLASHLIIQKHVNQDTMLTNFLEDC